MIYIQYSELTERYYLVPKSKKESKVDITADIKEIIEFENSKKDKEAVEGWKKEHIYAAIDFGTELANTAGFDEGHDGWIDTQIDKFIQSIKPPQQ